MKHWLFSLLVFILFSANASAQTTLARPINKDSTSNQLDLDVEIFGVHICYKGKLAGRFDIGYSFGAGFLMSSSFSKNDYFVSPPETFGNNIKHKVFIDYRISRKFHIYEAITHGFILSEDNHSGPVFGLETGIFCKLGPVELGIKPAVSFFLEDEKLIYGGLTHSYMTLKIPLSRW